MQKRTRWVIRGYRELEKFYETELPLGSLTEKEVVAVLQRLVCRHLSPDEIVDASVRKSSKRHNPGHFVKTKDATADLFCISIGQNPYYDAVAK